MAMVQSADGTEVITVDEGSGSVILVLHGGLSDESAWAKVAARLVDRFRVIRIRRRLYRLELPADPSTAYAREVEDVLAVARTLGSRARPGPAGAADSRLRRSRAGERPLTV